MASYKLSKTAVADLKRIYQRGLCEFGEAQADKYYAAFFSRFEQLTEHPYLYQAVDHIREGYRRSVCGVDSIYYRVDADTDTIEIMTILGHQNIEKLHEIDSPQPSYKDVMTGLADLKQENFSDKSILDIADED